MIIKYTVLLKLYTDLIGLNISSYRYIKQLIITIKLLSTPAS